MKTRTYLVTNQSEGSICVTGRQRIDIPGLCSDLPLVLPENSAKQTISRLKQRYPLLKIREAGEGNGLAVPPVSTPGKKIADTSTVKNATTSSGETESDKSAGNDAKSSGASGDASGTAKGGAEKTDPKTNESQPSSAAQKSDSKKGK